MRPQCPNIDCKNTKIAKDGHFQRSSDCRKIQRFRCKKCARRFSNATFTLEKNQKKRTINHTVFKLLGSGVSMRRIAKIVNVSRKTIERRIHYLDLKAELMHRKVLKKMEAKVSHLQFDDMITSIHTKLKPATISLAVDARSRVILGARTKPIPAFGLLAKASRKKYGKRENRHKEALEELFSQIAPCIQKEAIVRSDEHKFYPRVVKKHLNEAFHERYKGGRACVVGQGELKRLARDPLFAINHSCAMFRDNLKRLARRTWCTSKKIEMLQKHLNIYIWYHNQEILGDLTPL